MPDIDIDFDDRRRGEMVRYAADKWGHDRVVDVTVARFRRFLATGL